MTLKQVPSHSPAIDHRSCRASSQQSVTASNRSIDTWPVTKNASVPANASTAKTVNRSRNGVHSTRSSCAMRNSDTMSAKMFRPIQIVIA